jgi:hypothetical protein
MTMICTLNGVFGIFAVGGFAGMLAMAALWVTTARRKG